MAELIAVVVNAALEKATSTALDNIKLMLGFPEQLDAMKDHVQAIEAVLADADSKRSGTDSRRVMLWLQNVEEAAFEAEIVLDELLYESLRRQVLKNNRGVPQVCECSSHLFTLLKSKIQDARLSMRLGPRVRSINAKFQEYNSQIQTIGFVERVRPATYVAANRITESSPDRLLVGRDKEVSEIVKLLLDSSNNNDGRVSVLPITGMGGLGKTTLAKSVYNNQQIMDRFSKRGWTCVSNKVDETDILKGILESLKGENKQELDAIVQGIQEKLNGERFLFVLDDVWKFEWREGLLDILTRMAKRNSTSGGCCVLVTTRLLEVADGVRAFFSPFELKKLSDDHCWSIIVERVNEGGTSLGGLDVHKEQLLKRCQGLPLAAKVIGGLLCIDNRDSILDQILKIQEDVKEKIKPILRLSYDHLPFRCLKSCFVYCSVHPKDAQMDGDELIELWMAQGYLEDGAKGGKTMEKVGADYLTILLQSSLLEKCLSWSWGDKKYQMHDFVHDLAETISEEKHDGGKYPAFRHVAFGVEKSKNFWNKKSTLARIHEGDICDARVSECVHARVMHLYFSREMKAFENDVGKLIHLRSLTISGDSIETLPESLCWLYNLQTLKLSFCRKLKCLPEGLINLISLRHLHFFRGEEFEMPPNMGRLTCLQTLEFFNVREGNGHGIKELGFMENLKGSLSIRNLEVVESKGEAASAKLVAKKNMIELELNWASTTGLNNGEDVLQGLEPCSALQRLTITNFMGVQLPGWLGKLSVLVRLELNNCHNITQLGCSGDYGFPNLKKLKLNDCKNITQLGCSGDGGFPKLETLLIWGCSQLSSAPTSFPVLEDLNVLFIQVSAIRDIISTTTNSLKVLLLDGVSGMRRLSEVTESSLSSCLKRLEIWYCDDLTEIPSSSLACCTCLEELLIYECQELVSYPLNLQQTPCLSHITLTRCPKLFTTDGTLPRGFEHLTNLKTLRIGPDNSEQSIDWNGLRTGCSTTLQHLSMEGSCRTQLPQQLQHFSSLVSLSLSTFDSECLPDWLGKLTSLQRLYLEDFPKLEHLPTEAIRSLSNLQNLYISGCPLLRETQGDEIKALPNLKVNWPDY